MAVKAPTEQQIVNACLDLLGARGVFAWRQNQGAVTGEYKGKRRFLRFAGIKGISDIIGVLPFGRFLAVECKRPGNKPTIEQAAFLESVRQQGGASVWVRSVNELDAFLADLGV